MYLGCFILDDHVYVAFAKDNLYILVSHDFFSINFNTSLLDHTRLGRFTDVVRYRVRSS